MRALRFRRIIDTMLVSKRTLRNWHGACILMLYRFRADADMHVARSLPGSSVRCGVLQTEIRGLPASRGKNRGQDAHISDEMVSELARRRWCGAETTIGTMRSGWANNRRNICERAAPRRKSFFAAWVITFAVYGDKGRKRRRYGAPDSFGFDPHHSGPMSGPACRKPVWLSA